jgi:hypothetical protein
MKRLAAAEIPSRNMRSHAEEFYGMETTATIAIAREAARLGFLCAHGIGTTEDFELRFSIDSGSSLDQEKAELLAGIGEEVLGCGGAPRSDLCLRVCRDVLAHLAGVRVAPEACTPIQ